MSRETFDYALITLLFVGIKDMSRRFAGQDVAWA
jgi:hypothetical protein